MGIDKVTLRTQRLKTEVGIHMSALASRGATPLFKGAEYVKRVHLSSLSILLLRRGCFNGSIAHVCNHVMPCVGLCGTYTGDISDDMIDRDGVKVAEPSSSGQNKEAPWEWFEEWR